MGSDNRGRFEHEAAESGRRAWRILNSIADRMTDGDRERLFDGEAHSWWIQTLAARLRQRNADERAARRRRVEPSTPAPSTSCGARPAEIVVDDPVRST